MTARVERRHRSREFILLKDLDQSYPAHSIRLILDNHSSHVSKETKDYLATRPNRFKYVHTPTHGSWLNIVETLFGKMARTFLKRIRVESWEELRERILQGIAEIKSYYLTPTALADASPILCPLYSLPNTQWIAQDFQFSLPGTASIADPRLRQCDRRISHCFRGGPPFFASSPGRSLAGVGSRRSGAAIGPVAPTTGEAARPSW